jgi:hypothetical protein
MRCSGYRNWSTALGLPRHPEEKANLTLDRVGPSLIALVRMARPADRAERSTRFRTQPVRCGKAHEQVLGRSNRRRVQSKPGGSGARLDAELVENLASMLADGVVADR